MLSFKSTAKPIFFYKNAETSLIEEHVNAYLNDTKQWYDQTRSITPGIKDQVWQKLANNLTLAKKLVEKTVNEFDFIGTVERLDESLVLLSIMMDVQVTDVLYSNAKLSGGYMIRPKEHECRQIGKKRPLFPSAEKFLESERFQQMIKIDTLLHDAVDRSIDRTIEYVGRALVDSKVKEFMDAKAALDKKCPFVRICEVVPKN